MDFTLRLLKNREALRYVCSAAFATFADLGFFALIHDQVPEQLAYSIAYAVAVTGRFILDRYWTFPQAQRSNRLGRQFMTYWAVALAALGLGSVVFAGLRALELKPLAAKVLSVPPTTIIAYFGLKIWVFGLGKSVRRDAT